MSLFELNLRILSTFSEDFYGYAGNSLRNGVGMIMFHMRFRESCYAVWLGSALCTNPAMAVMFWETADPAHNTTTPGDNSGWQYEGKFFSLQGVPIAPHFFITATHILGGSASSHIGTVFHFHGDAYTTIAFHDIPDTDLQIWEVNHAKPFPSYAPLSSGVNDIGALATVMGRGTRRGVAVTKASELKGWKHGTADAVQRWGRNVVTGFITLPGFGELLYCDFNRNSIANECHLSGGDSGGGLFVLEEGLWRLAGINFSVDGPFRKDLSEGNEGYLAALFDCGGMEYKDGTWFPIAEEVDDKPSAFYASRISASLSEIIDIAPEAGTIAMENFTAWQKLYFTPAQIAAPVQSGPLADFDADGIVNLLEYAFHLDPIFNEQKIVDAATGFRGLPLIRKELIEGDERLTIEFLRRKNSNGAALTYTHEFSSDLDEWETVGTVNVTSINERWERVKVIDAVTREDSPSRFGRVRVTMSE